MITLRLYRASFVLSLTLFVASLTVGIYHSVTTGGGLPTIAVDNIEQLITKLAVQGDYDAVIDQLRLLQKIETSFSWAGHNNMGLMFFQQEKLDEALMNFQRALELKPHSTELHHNIAKVLAARGEFDKATEHYHQVLVLDPNDVAAHDKLGSILYSRGQPERAIGHYRRALQIRPDNAQLHYNVGNILRAQGELDEAIDHYERALGSEPDNVEARVNLATVLSRQGNNDAAIDHYRRALQIRPDLIEVYIALGSTLCSLGKLGPATDVFHQALQVQPDKAIEYYRRALQAQTRFGGVHFGIGVALARAGHIELALKHFENAMRIKPNWPLPLNAAAWYLATHWDPAVRDGKDAIKFARRAVQLSRKRDPMILDTMAAAYAESRLFDQAVATAHEAIAVAESAQAEVLAGEIRSRLELYQQQKPYHEPIHAPPVDSADQPESVTSQ